MTSGYHRFAEFKQLTEEEDRLGLLSSPDIGFRREWEDLLALRGMSLEGHRLVKRSEKQDDSVDFGNGGE